MMKPLPLLAVLGTFLFRPIGAQLFEPANNDLLDTAPETNAIAENTENIPSTTCTFCDSADGFDGSLSFAGIPCDQWALMAMFAPPEGEQCYVLRAAAVQFCGCPTDVTETCELCPTGNMDGYDPNQSLLFLPSLTCQDIVDMPAVDGDDTCAFLDRFSYLCGCPDVVPECSLCDRDANGLPLPMARPDEVLVEGSPAEGIPHTTCARWDKLLSLETPTSDTSATVAEGRDASTGGSLSTGCEKAKQQSDANTGMQLDGVCGCPNVQPARECKPCDEGYVVSSANNTNCEHVAFIAPYVTNSSQCELVRMAASSIDCCVEGTNEEIMDENDVSESTSQSSATGRSNFFIGALTAFAFMLWGLFV